MTMTISGDGSITGLVAGGLPDATVTQAEVATGVAGTGPAFSAYQSSSQTLTSVTLTKILFQSEEYDTNSNFASSRFTPTVAGYYQLNAGMQSFASYTYGFIDIYKNGSREKAGNAGGIGNASNNWTVSSLVYLNGSTDYVEIYGFLTNGQGLNNTFAATYFNGFLARAA